ncbi:MAG TPA: TIGR03088 family PEP-CTERM/XrtA system glycosyltransferase [Burkholderiales bacterium]|nr:TIGR03088 family PEP-CTERM/XrtA system glycosyltransferase [Burkholderiales bacterium]
MRARNDFFRNPQSLPLIAHVIYRLDFGGLENGLVNLINGMREYRHAVICIDDFTDFRLRIKRDDVRIFALKKRPGTEILIYFKLYRLFRELRPAIVHSRNLAGLDSLIPAFAAGVPIRIHGEHGRDPSESARYRWLRRMAKPLIHHYIALSRDLEKYLQGPIAVKRARISQIYNGVNVERFRPRSLNATAPPVHGFNDPGWVVIGTVGRMKEVKDPLTLVRAFIWSLKKIPEARQRLRLVIIGDGPLLEPARALLAKEGFDDLAWLPGARHDVHQILPDLDVFVLPSLAEGVSNTILEAMACGLPVIATDVGGNPELVQDGVTGRLIPRRDLGALSQAIGFYLAHPAERLEQGRAARRVVENHFSLGAMVGGYANVYERLMRERGEPAKVTA